MVLKNILFKLTIFFEIFWLLIDTINGILIYYKGIYIFAPTIRLFVFLILLTISVIFIKKTKFSIFILTSIILLSALHIIEYQNIESLKMIAKVSMPILFYYVLYIQIIKSKITIKQIKTITFLNAIILLINQYLYYLNIGFDSYGMDEKTGILKGGTGFFYAGNEVGATLLIIFALVISEFLKKSIIYSFIIFILFIGAAIALMSKTAIFGVLLIYIFFLISKYPLPSLFILAFIIIIPLIMYYSSELLDFFKHSIDRWTYFYDKYGMIYLFGGVKRWTYINDWFLSIQDNPIKLIIGSGWAGEAENNFFDLLEAFGLIGVSIYIFWTSFIFKLFHRKSQSPILFFISLVFLLIILVSFFAGHTLQSAMLALFLALVANYNNIETLRKVNEKN